MCGIAGIVLKPAVTRSDLGERVALMSDCMTHRGPDDAGIFVAPDGRAALVNRRLAIRDLSPLGHMPMVSDDPRLALTYNGEIYNADELRAELVKIGHTFRSTSDTEVILRGYEAWGSVIFARLRGIFAIALYDGQPGMTGQRSSPDRGRLLLVRDQLGVKPLYYARTDAGLIFASELKALLSSGLVSSEIEPTSIVAYLEFGSVPTPRTIYRDIHALEPATILECDLGTFQTHTRSYWSLPRQPRETPHDVVAETRQALLDVVRSQLVSDVPLGAFLSGGMDSSAVVALMRQATNGTLRTCSMIFDETEYSEAAFAREVANAVGAEHFERVVTVSDVLNEMPRMIWALDQPSVDGINSYFVSQTARQAGLTVALSGLGGDELFGGYPTFYAAPRLYRQLRRIEKLPAGATLTRTALSYAPRAPRYAKIQDVLQSSASPAGAYFAYRGVFAPSEARALVTPEVWNASGGFDPYEYVARRAGGDARLANASEYAANDMRYAWTSRAELATYTLNQLLRDTDAMSMAHSLEVRVPLLDHSLVERIVPLPDSVKQNGSSGGAAEQHKSLLLKAMGDSLPAIVRERRVKQGFTFPFARWLRGDLAHYFARYSGDAQGVLEPRAVARVMNGFQRGDMHWSRAWSLLVLSAWMAERAT